MRFNKVHTQGHELTYIRQVLEKSVLSGDGKFSNKCDTLFEDEIGVKKSLLTPSCTDALEMCAILLDVKPGDEIIVPSFTFVSTINAFVLRGAKPIFIDIRPDTLNIDETLLENLISPKTKAIVVVHYAGVGCEMNSIVAIAKKYSIPVIEDNAHGLFGKYDDRYLGTFGTFATQSFHETKNFTCGEGGALFINDRRYIDRAEIIREKGTNRSKFFRGEIDKYTWVDLGSSFLLSDLSAAFLYGQLEQRLVIQEKRKNIWNTYYSMLKTWADDNGIKLPFVPKECKQAYHMFYLIMPSLNNRTRFINYLKQNGLHAVFHYLPLHLSPMGGKLSSSNTDCPVTESISDRLVRLPFFTNLNMDEIDFEIFYKFQ